MDVICGTLVDNKVASQAMGKKRDWSINGVSGKKIKLDPFLMPHLKITSK